MNQMVIIQNPWTLTGSINRGNKIMSKINWNEAPEGAERYSVDCGFWLKKIGGSVFYHKTSGVWCIAASGDLTWGGAIEKPTSIASSIDATIAERGSRYGNFEDGAVIMQKLKDVMRETAGWQRLKPNQREALEMIQHKIGRILNGDPDYDDNYRDICGYSQLVLDQLNGESK